MFTLKLFRRRNDQMVTKIVAVHRVVSMTIGEDKKLLELQAFDQGNDYETYFVGDAPEVAPSNPGEVRDIIDRHGSDNFSLWGWGLLENWEGNTTQHFRPASYG